MNLGVLAYVPPKGIGYPEVFLENLRQFPTKNPLILYSDQPWPNVKERIFNPERAKANGQVHAISNLVFLQAVRIASSRGLTHFLYIECDSRVGKKHWDQIVFDEFFSGPKAEVGGTLLCCHGHDSDQFKIACKHLLARYHSEGNFPIKDFVPVRNSWGKIVPILEPSCVFAMGSLSVLSVDFMKQIWGACDLLSTSKMFHPWDKEIGIRAFTKWGMDAFNKFKHLTTVYSTYGRTIRTEGQLMDMLKKGEVVAVHQVESAATLAPPVPIQAKVDPPKEEKPKIVQPAAVPRVTTHSMIGTDGPIIVAIPFGNKDSKLALDGLNWMLEMGQRPDYDCILSFDSTTAMAAINSMKSVAERIFKSVLLISYPRPPVLRWPYAPNWVFRHTAQYIHKNLNRPWLWREPDMMALAPDWIDQLQSEYNNSGKPFMGSVVPGMSHCNGTAVYPGNYPERCPSGMACTEIAFDFAHAQEMMPECHNAIHLMQHIWGIHNGKPHPRLGNPICFDTQQMVDQWLDPRAVTLHRMKNDSLIKRLRERRNRLP